MRVKVVDSQVTVREGKNKTTGQPYRLRMQRAVLDRGEWDRTPFTLMLGEDSLAYPPGDYVISPSSFGVGDFDALELRRIVLEAVKPAVSAKVA